MCSLQDDNHNTPEPPPSKEAGLHHQPIRACDPGCPTYGVAMAVQGEDMGWSGRGRVRGRSARVQRGWEPASVQLPRRPPGVRVQLPSAVLDWARQAIVRRCLAQTGRGGKFLARARVETATAGRCYARQEGDTVLRRGQPEGCAGRTGSRARSPGGEPRGALSKVQGRRLVRGRRGAGADTSQPAAKRAESSCLGRRAPPAHKSAGARGAVAKGAGGSPTPLPSSLTSSSVPLPPRPLLSVPCPRAAAGAGPGTRPPTPRTASPDAPGMLRAAEPLTWGHGAGIQGKRARGAARLLLASASPPDRASAGLRPGLRAARRGQTAAAARAAAAAADRGRPVAAGSLFATKQSNINFFRNTGL
ncbi:translation initiation factor IF-2-like [Phodopus roborovskii]|uniref:translation initiation factor IF-2-like n=1 Tax=Phodopus roborovskii TaxID=109678 RepID=UPI0021E40DEE|nr:translation initiation factor IF-2-like [Phodopus roborovskii]